MELEFLKRRLHGINRKDKTPVRVLGESHSTVLRVGTGTVSVAQSYSSKGWERELFCFNETIVWFWRPVG